MSAIGSLLNGLKDTIFLADNLKRLAGNVDRLEQEVRSQDRRLVRLEAFAEFGMRGGAAWLTDDR